MLSAILEHQTAMLRRLEDADRALVQIVLAGGSLDDLCEQVVGFLDGAAMVTTTDGRVIARAGSSRELARAEGQRCFDRTGRLLTESEPMGLGRDDRPGAARGPGRAAVRIVAGHLDHGVLIAFCSHRDLTADDVRLLERAATVAALAITKDQAVAAVESKYRAEFLRDALAGRAGSPPTPWPTPPRSGGASTGRWSSSSPRPTRTTTARAATPTRCASSSSASPERGPTPWVCVTRGAGHGLQP